MPVGLRVHQTPKEVKMLSSLASGSPKAGFPSSQFILRLLILLSYSGFCPPGHGTWNRAASAEKRLTSNLAPAPSLRKRSCVSIFSQRAPRSHSACADYFSREVSN